MPRKITPTAEIKARLSREIVLQTALDIADQQGIQTLTMRALGAALKVEAMSLYYHFKNKDQLLDGLIDLVFAEVALPKGEDWKAALRTRSQSLRAALIRHRWATGLMESRTLPGPANMRHHDAVLRCLRESGFSLSATAHAYSLLNSYVYGFVLQELALPFNTGEEAAPVAAQMFNDLTARDYPYLIEIATGHVMQDGYTYSQEFDIGLEIVLDGIEGLLIHRTN